MNVSYLIFVAGMLWVSTKTIVMVLSFVGNVALLAFADPTWKLGQTCCAQSKGITKETVSSFQPLNRK